MCMPRYFGVKTIEIKIKEEKKVKKENKKTKTIHQTKVEFE